MLASQSILLSHIDPTISQWQDDAYVDIFSTASLGLMNYRRAIRLRRENLKQSMGVTEPPVSAMQLPRENTVEHRQASHEDLALIQSGDKAAIRARLAELDRQILALVIASKQKEDEARGYHEAALASHSRIVQLFNEQISSEFQARNKIGEYLCAVYLYEVLGIRCGTLEIDRRMFETPLGKRRLDAYLLEHGIAIESKVGYQSLTGRLRNEIAKDEYLLRTGALRQVHWLFYTPSSSKLLARLRSGPIIVSEGWLTAEIKQRVFKNGQPEWLPL